jgi:uncharacterized membrane protein YdjX (TVP38/TMEM64 family)
MSHKSHHTSQIVGVVSLIVPIIIIYLFRHEIYDLTSHISEAGIWAPIISIVIMGILSATPIPTDPIVVLNGAIFGPFWGFLISWLGNNLAAFVEYAIGLGIRQATDFDHQRRYLPLGLHKFSPNSYTFLLLGRFIPQFGGKLVSFAAGIYQVNFFKYLWTTLVANLFGSLLFALGGHTFLKFLIP